MIKVQDRGETLQEDKKDGVNSSICMQRSTEKKEGHLIGKDLRLYMYLGMWLCH
jgi:hypothetical protein